MMGSSNHKSVISQLATGHRLAKKILSQDNQSLIQDLGLVVSSDNEYVWLDHPLELLDESLILREIRPEPLDLLRSLEIHWDIASTNDYLLNKMQNSDSHGHVCLAERQTAGRGRRGRNWVSPFGVNLYLSIGWTFPSKMKNLSALSLVVGMEAVRMMREMGLEDVWLKWPNDLLRQQGKLGGILIEAANSGSQLSLIIGIGLNFEAGVPLLSGVDQSIGFVPKHSGITRNLLAGRLIGRLIGALEAFSHTGFGSYQREWAGFNQYQNQNVSVVLGDRTLRGIDRGIDEQGHLILESEGKILTFSSGEVSMRAEAR